MSKTYRKGRLTLTLNGKADYIHLPWLLFAAIVPVSRCYLYHACVCHAKAHCVIQIIQMLNCKLVAFFFWQVADGRDTV